MRVDRLLTTQYAKNPSTHVKSKSFGQMLNESTQANINILMPKADSLFTSNAGRFSYDESSTEENPIILVEGFDKNGSRFTKKIPVNEVNPYNATEMEMIALGVHTGKINGIEDMIHAMPLNHRPSEPGQRVDFVALFEKNIADQKTMKRYADADLIKANMEFYIDYWKNKGK